MLKNIAMAYLVIINLVSFVVFGIDKKKAKLRVRRIPERTLFILSFLGGSIGAYLAMQFFNHKTKKTKFFLGIPGLILVQIVLVLWIAKAI